ncbi:MAG TPA: DNA internalization-related competence protein ComEC/Rec2 [Woeseiaceae bacterium]|jgi:competence protein ComEC|nr:DNA internalization-related competence protein ComEC/Rec2 [Woeseiaceae bacterium]
MIRACLYLLAGIYALQLSSFAKGSDLLAVAFVASFVAAFLRAWHGPSWACVGLALYAFTAASILGDRLDPIYAGDSILTTVRIADFPQRRGPTVSFIAVPVGDTRLPRRLRVGWFEPSTSPALGEVWQLELRLRRPRGNLNPGVFDYEAWLFRAGIGASGYVVEGRRNLRIRDGETGPIDEFRQRFVQRLLRVLPADHVTAVLAAISVGARHLVSRAQWERYARTGTSHLMAISGLHIGLAAGGAYILASLVGSWVFRRGNTHVGATAVAAVVAGAYGLVSGLGLPSQRAAIMIGLLALAVIRRRQPRPYRILAAACFVLATIAPVETMAPGFKLSFAAVLILVWLGGQRRHRRDGVGRWLKAVLRLGGVQLALLFGLLPLTASIFGRAALLAPAVNLLVLPVFSFVTVPLTLAGMLLDGPAAVLGDGCLKLAALSVGGVEAIIERAAAMPGSAATLPRLQGAARLLLVLPLLWVLLPRGWPGRSLAAVGIAAIVTYLPPRPAQGCFEFGVLDVGQGLAVVVQTANHTLLYDTGAAYRSGNTAAAAVVLPYLAAGRIDRLDTLIISHSDIDHAGGASPVLAQVPASTVLAGESLPGIRRRVEPCLAGASWRSDGVVFELLHPATAAAFEGNDASCVLLVSTGSSRLFIGGDIEESAERRLVQRQALPAVDVAIVPHHGSQTSSSPGLVAALRPAVAIVSAGFGNRWGLPRREVVERWESAGAQVVSTADSGAIHGRVCSVSGLQSLQRFRVHSARLWHE